MSGVWVASMLLLWIVVVVLTFFLIGALRELGIIQLRLGNDPGALITTGGLDRGALAPNFEVSDESGRVVRLSDLDQRARLLVFVSPTCTACTHLVPHLNEVQSTRDAEFDFVVVCRGDRKACLSFARMNQLAPRLLIDESGDAEAAMQVEMTPFTYLLDYQNRVVIRGIANDWRQLEALLDQEGTLETHESEEREDDLIYVSPSNDGGSHE